MGWLVSLAAIDDVADAEIVPGQTSGFDVRRSKGNASRRHICAGIQGRAGRRF